MSNIVEIEKQIKKEVREYHKKIDIVVHSVEDEYQANDKYYIIVNSSNKPMNNTIYDSFDTAKAQFNRKRNEFLSQAKFLEYRGMDEQAKRWHKSYDIVNNGYILEIQL